MSARLASAHARAAGTRGRGIAARRRRRALYAGAAAILVAVVAVTIAPLFGTAVKELALPLRHEDIIRQQAREKGLDPALIAGVIYAESRFRDQTSPAGARGLMQITPATAQDIARKSGGTAFQLGDLGTPQINIAYGSYYLRYLLNKYGDERLSIAAYNAGESNVDRWLAAARARGRRLDVTRDIPFPETREYVGRVVAAQRSYRRQYRRELGL